MPKVDAGNDEGEHGIYDNRNDGLEDGYEDGIKNE